MDLFRRNQKLIFWIVTIIIVPSFVLVWGVSGTFGNQPQVEFEVGKVNGKNVKYQEFEAFRKRMGAAIGGIPLQFTGAPGAGTQAEEVWKYVLTYALLQDAEAAGSRASDLQVGTYLDNGHPTLSGLRAQGDAQAMDRAVDNLCRQMSLSRQDFLQGVREWQTIGNYLMSDSNLTAVNDETVFAFYSLNKAQLVIKRVRIAETEAVKEQAKREVMEKPAEELERLAREYAAGKSSDRRYRTPAGWRFAYVMAPLVPASSVRQPSEKEIEDQYESGKNYLYNNRPLSEVQDRIKAELLQQEIERQTLRNFTVDVDGQLRGQGSQMALTELVKLTPLAKYGVTAGDTGEELLSAEEVMKRLPAGATAELRMGLESLDLEPAEPRDAFIKEWKAGFSLEGRPFKADNGFLRLRLLDYRPSEPAPIDGPDGKIRPEIQEIALVDMVGDRAKELVDEQAEDMERRLREFMEAREKGTESADVELAADFEQLPTETINYLELADNNYQLGRLVVGDLMGPLPFVDAAGGTTGQEILVLVERRLATREAFENETPEMRRRFRDTAMSAFRASYGFTYTMNGPTAVVQPSPAIMGGLVDRLNRLEISVNPELLRSNAAEG